MVPSGVDAHPAPIILVIAFKFPPYINVGGNRWMNLANELARHGCQVHVVTVKWNAHDGSPWADARLEKRVTVHRIPSGFPHNLFYRRFRCRILNLARKILFSRYLLRRIWWDDEAQHWGPHLLAYCTKLVSRVHIDAIIATGHPFEATYWASVLSVKVSLPLIQDLRDPWIDNPYMKYTPRQRRLLLPRVRAALENCDRVVTVTRGLLDVYGRHSDLTHKGVVIPNGHGIDGSAWGGATATASARFVPPHPRLVYLGNMGNGRDEPFEWLLRAIETSKRTGGQSAHIWVFSVRGKQLQRRYQRYVRSGILSFNPPVPHDEIPAVLGAYDAAIHLTSRSFPYLVSTKIYEYAAAKIPTLSINYGGEAEQLVRDLDCGVTINLLSDDAEKPLEWAIAGLNRHFRYRVDEYHWTALAQRYLTLVRDVLAERACAEVPPR